MRNVLGVDENFPTDFVLETAPEKSDYENEDDDKDGAASDAEAGRRPRAKTTGRMRPCAPTLIWQGRLAKATGRLGEPSLPGAT
jgi:hypothetical protein